MTAYPKASGIGLSKPCLHALFCKLATLRTPHHLEPENTCERGGGNAHPTYRDST